jgi:hypothetical protein
MRNVVLTLSVLTGLIAAPAAANAQASCKACADQKKACMKNYAGPTCNTEYKICLKSCKSK